MISPFEQDLRSYDFWFTKANDILQTVSQYLTDEEYSQLQKERENMLVHIRGCIKADAQYMLSLDSTKKRTKN